MEITPTVWCPKITILTKHRAHFHIAGDSFNPVFLWHLGFNQNEKEVIEHTHQTQPGNNGKHDKYPV